MTRNEIRKMFEDELARARSLTQVRWAHPFTELKFSKGKTFYGKASSKGTIIISEIFLGTDARDHLRNTIRHELAHLIAGIRNHHNHIWAHYMTHLGGIPSATSAPGTRKLGNNMKRAWQLLAQLEDGTTEHVQFSHHRMSKYIRYTPTQDKHYKLGDKVVLKFIYKRAPK